MGIMASDTWYLPEEELHYRNYPEVNYAQADIQLILQYAMRVDTAIFDYSNGTFDKIDIDVHDLANYIDLCRSVCSKIGTAPNVCFDILLEIRSIQKILQTLMYAKNKYGNTYIGTPTNL